MMKASCKADRGAETHPAGIAVFAPSLRLLGSRVRSAALFPGPCDIVSLLILSLCPTLRPLPPNRS